MTRAVALALLTLAGCASIRMRVDSGRMKSIEKLAVVTFVGNRTVSSPDGAFMSSEPTAATAKMIFETGIPAFFSAVGGAQRFTLLLPDKVQTAKSYAAFPEKLTGMTGNASQIAPGWRYVAPEDAQKIANLLEEIDADAALITWWHFSLDQGTTANVGASASATTHAHLRAWLIGRDGKIVADDELDVFSDESLSVHNGRYDAKIAAILFDDPITTCALRMVADFSNAREKAREK